MYHIHNISFSIVWACCGRRYRTHSWNIHNFDFPPSFIHLNTFRSIAKNMLGDMLHMFHMAHMHEHNLLLLLITFCLSPLAYNFDQRVSYKNLSNQKMRQGVTECTQCNDNKISQHFCNCLRFQFSNDVHLRRAEQMNKNIGKECKQKRFLSISIFGRRFRNSREKPWLSSIKWKMYWLWRVNRRDKHLMWINYNWFLVVWVNRGNCRSTKCTVRFFLSVHSLKIITRWMISCSNGTKMKSKPLEYFQCSEIATCECHQWLTLFVEMHYATS